MDIAIPWTPVTMVRDGWYTQETSEQGESFRWVQISAHLDIAMSAGLATEIALDVEVGPALGLESFTLQIYENGDRVCFPLYVEGRGRVVFHIDANAYLTRTIELLAQSDVAPIEAPGDPRMLAYRIFSIEARPVLERSDLEDELAESRVIARTLEETIEDLGDLHETTLQSRDAVIERLEWAVAQLRDEVARLQHAAFALQAEFEAMQQIAQERLEVIRAIHEERQSSVG